MASFRPVHCLTYLRKRVIDVMAPEEIPNKP